MCARGDIVESHLGHGLLRKRGREKDRWERGGREEERERVCVRAGVLSEYARPLVYADARFTH